MCLVHSSLHYHSWFEVYSCSLLPQDWKCVLHMDVESIWWVRLLSAANHHFIAGWERQYRTYTFSFLGDSYLAEGPPMWPCIDQNVLFLCGFNSPPSTFTNLGEGLWLKAWGRPERAPHVAIPPPTKETLECENQRNQRGQRGQRVLELMNNQFTSIFYMVDQ